MLIYNIEGNDNYGEAFSSAVEQAFQLDTSTYGITAGRGPDEAVESIS